MSDMFELKELINPEGIIDHGIIAAQKSFYEYCKLINPKFYRDDRPYQKELCDVLQDIFAGTLINAKTGLPYKKLSINMPPRHGKSYTLTLFTQWAMGKNNETRIISVSYNDILAGRFAKNIRDGIEAEKLDSRLRIFSDVFPSTRVKRGDAAAQLWSLEGQFFNYLATGFGGTITGIGCSIGIIDDPIKNDQEAFNERVLDEQWSWYTDTFLSRVEENGIQIITMTRWSTKDLVGRVIDAEGDDWYVFSRKACIDPDTQTMLCPALLSWESYMKRRKLTSQEIADANYQQEPIDVKGKLYSEFRTYEQLPRDDVDKKLLFEKIISYTDTADEGNDDLASIVAGVYQGEGYLLDVIMTDEPMEITEPAVAQQLYSFTVNMARIESNNGGRGFARNVERLLWENHQTRSVDVLWFHQSANKHSRILAGATFVMKHLLLPPDWATRWPRFYAALNSYQKSGKNKHDDGPDCITGIAETIQDLEGVGPLDIWWL